MDKNAKSSIEQAHSKRRIKNFLIDRRFQLGWVFRVALMVTAIVAVMGYFLYGTLAESIELTNVQVLTTSAMTEQAQQSIIQKGAKDKLYTGIVLGGSLAGLVLVLSLFTIVVTHKVAGPAYKMKRLLSTVDSSRLQLFEKLRKGDELHDIFQEFSDMLRRLREARHLDVEQLDAAVSYLKSSGVPEAQYAPLQSLSERYKKSIEMDS